MAKGLYRFGGVISIAKIALNVVHMNVNKKASLLLFHFILLWA